MAVRIFRHYVSKALVALALAEGLILAFSVYAGTSLLFWDPSAAAKVAARPQLPLALVFTGVMLGALTSTGLYQQGLRDGLRGITVRILVAFALGFAAMLVIFYLFPWMFVGRAAFSLTLVSALLGIVGCRLLFLAITDANLLRKRVLVLGTGREAQEIARLRRKADMHGIRILGYVHLKGEHDEVDPAKVLKPDGSLPDMARRLGVDEIVIAADDRHKSFPVEEVIECKMSGIELVDRVTFYERQLGKINIDLLRPTDIVFLDGFTHAVLKSYSKRVFDILASGAMLILTSPIMLLAAAAVFLESPGDPILYRQERVGRNGRVFKVAKFRSMRVDAEQHGAPQWATRNDPRVTSVGAFMRKTRIDELPQLFTVLRGDMSFVGPRPERPQFVESLSQSIPYFGMRHRVNPGITGWAQVMYPYGASEEDARQKLQYDLYYIKNYSVFLDLAILFQTVQVVLWGQGAR